MKLPLPVGICSLMGAIRVVRRARDEGEEGHERAVQGESSSREGVVSRTGTLLVRQGGVSRRRTRQCLRGDDVRDKAGVLRATRVILAVVGRWRTTIGDGRWRILWAVAGREAIDSSDKARGEVGFAGVRKVKGSCICMGYFRRGMRSPSTLTVRIDSERFKVKSSKLVLVYPSRITSYRVTVCGTSNSEKRVYKGKIHYIKGCVCSCNLASGARVAIRALTKVGALRLFMRGKGITGIQISVKDPVLAPTRVPIITRKSGTMSRPVLISKGRCRVAYMSVKGPRTIICMSSISGLPVRRVKPGFRGRREFPEHIGARFMGILSERATRVHI